jgi:rubredoxin
MNQLAFLVALMLAVYCQAFVPANMPSTRASFTKSKIVSFRMAEESQESVKSAETESVEEEEEEFTDAGSKMAAEKQKRADELRSQEVFMKRSTGVHKCSSCDWKFDQKVGDSFMIGGMIKPDTPFSDLPSNWRCPTCRASKDNFQEVTEEIPGFEVNQGYGLGGNSMTSGQKSGIVFGGLFVFFILFLGGYGLS